YRVSLLHADRSGQMREMLAARWMLADTLVHGSVPVPKCIERSRELISTHGVEIPGVCTALGLFYAMARRFDEAREMADRARWILEERMRVKRLLKFVAVYRGAIERLTGDLAAAEREFRAALEIDRTVGEERDDRSQTAARLAFVLWRQGRDDEAARMAAISASSAPTESVAARALAAVARGRATGDPELARAAVRSLPGEMLNLRADLLVELAAVLRSSGNDEGAMDVEEQAAR